MESVRRRCMIDLACDLCRDWRKFGYVNGLSKEVEQIEQDYRRNVVEQAYRILQAWRQKNGSKATYEALGKAFRSEAMQRIDLVEKYCEGGGNKGFFKTGVLEGHLRTGSVSSSDVVAISNELGTKWIWVGRLLGLEDTIIDDIRENNGNLYECSQQMLQSWTQKSTSQATYERLAQALTHIAVSKCDIAEKYCTEHRQSPDGASVPHGEIDIQQMNRKMEQLQVRNPKETGGASNFDGDGDVERINNSPVGLRHPLPVPDDCIRKKFIIDLPYYVWGALIVKLDPPRELPLRGDFKDLAAEMGFDMEKILYFKSLKNPTEIVLTSCSSRSIEDLGNKLDLIGREDARLILDEWVKSQGCNCTVCEN